MASLWMWALVISLLILVIYLIGTWNHDHFSKRNVPSIKALPFLGSMSPITFSKMSFADFIFDIYNKLEGHKYGGVYEFLKPVLVLRDPELIKMVTVKDFEHFLDHRTLFPEDIEPLFGKSLFNLQDGNKLIVELKDLFTRYTNDVIATSAFGIGCDSLKNPNNEFYTIGKRFLSSSAIEQLKFIIFLFSPRLMKILNIKFLPDKVVKFFSSLIIDAMKIREQKNIIRPDMIHLLMQAKNGTLKSEENDQTHEGNFKPELDNDDIVSQAMEFFFAGFDTVSTLMCFASHQLAVHPDIQSRLQQEIDQTLNENDGKITYESLNTMKYLDMIVSETLRLYPPAMFTDRRCVKTYTLPTEPSYTLKPGDGVWIPVYGLHRDPEYFPNPDKFDPERFSDENKDKITPFTYLPFGSGPRSCIGNRFALMEAKIALVQLLSRFDFKVVSKTSIPIKLSKLGFNMGAEGGFWVGLEERHQAN